jgi:S1-C subfamily serine protease
MLKLAALSATFLFACLVVPCQADELGDKGREIFKQNQRAVVTVQVVMKTTVSMPGQGSPSREAKQDITGTVVDGSGLTVLALSACDPSSMYESMMAGMADENMQFKMETELTDVKILMDDGTELPSEVVLRDKDLDLAFIRPKVKPANLMPAIDFAKGAQAQVLDQVITLNRLGNAAGRAYSASVERITAIVQKPRTFYIPDSTMTSTSLGSPAFALDGNVLGVFVMRTIKSKSGMGMFNFQPDGLTSIILPAADVLKAAKQAPTKAEEKKDEEKEKQE